MTQWIANLSQWSEVLNHPGIRWPLTTLYVLVLLLIAFYGLHRYLLVLIYFRHRHKTPKTPALLPQTWPAVTVQLPMFNEGNVAARIIDAACHLQYPADQLQIQVVDDSTDIDVAEQIAPLTAVASRESIAVTGRSASTTQEAP